jgi:hypothetical protein
VATTVDREDAREGVENVELAGAAAQESEGPVSGDWYKQIDQFSQCFDRTLQATMTEAWTSHVDATRIDDLEKRLISMLEKVQKWRT